MKAPSPKPSPTPLEERLISLINANGPITIADYMADALGHPHDGYYASRQSIGASGDFITAPEISQVFGELIGAFVLQTWLDMGAPPQINLIELGPGRGVLMEDILRAASIRPKFLDAVNVRLVETSGRLRHEQSQRLRASAARIDWDDSFADTPDGPMILIANEFFDCLPIRQFERKDGGWRERMIGVSEDGASLAFTTAKTPPIDAPLPPETDENAAETVFEHCRDAIALSEAIAARLKAHAGRALIVDYGRIGAAFGDTLQAVKDQAFWPVLSEPGRADITAHVDFTAIAKAAIETGAGAFGPLGQGAFLQHLGLGFRLDRLTQGKSAEEQAEIHAGAHRLAAPSQMGELFKALCLSSPDLPPPPGF